MANADKNKLIKIYGVTLPESKFRVRPYGHGMTKIKLDKDEEVFVSYVDYFIDDLIALIKQQNLGNKFKELMK